MEANNQKRLKVIKFSALGLVLLYAVFFLIDKGARHSDLEQTGKINKIVNHSIDPQLIVFGSSVSEVGVSPAIISSKTGLTAYNCSINGTRFKQYKGLIDEFNGYSKTNEVVLMVETYFSFEKVDALAESENFIAQVGNTNVYNALYSIQPDLVWRSRFVPFYKYTTVSYRFYKNSLIGWKNILKGRSDRQQDGYYPVSRHWEADADEAIRNTPPFNIQLDTGIIAEYTTTLKSLTYSGKKVFIILTPMYTAMLSRITDISPLRNELQKISAQTGVKFLDFSRSEICNEKAFFYNSNHLNIDGAQKFSSILADTLSHILQK